MLDQRAVLAAGRGAENPEPSLLRAPVGGCPTSTLQDQERLSLGISEDTAPHVGRETVPNIPRGSVHIWGHLLLVPITGPDVKVATGRDGVGVGV